MNEDPHFNQYLDTIRELDFVRGLQFSAESKRLPDRGVDGQLRIQTPKGTFTFDIEEKNSYLDRSLLTAFIAQAKHHIDATRRPILLFARYVPTPSAELLSKAGINFLDRVGNMHLALGKNYTRTTIGNREPKVLRDTGTPGAARVQLLFVFAADEEAGTKTVRQLAEASGLSKSTVARLRDEFVQESFLKYVSGHYELRDRKEISQRLLSGYGQTLRPKLLINRFRAPEADPEVLLSRLRKTFSNLSLKWSVTGTQAAFQLERYYRAPEVALFIDNPSREELREFRFLPDRDGPITLLRPFGVLPFWKEISGITVAHPWLIYAELMHSPDSRAHEAAEQLRARFIT
jgi:hypothetical protein